MIQFRENNFVPFFQIKYEYIKYVHVTCVELWFVFFSRIKNWHLEGSKKQQQSCTRVFKLFARGQKTLDTRLNGKEY